jgi:hypothetical protein
VEIENENAAALQGAFANVLAQLKKGQIKPPRMTPSTFIRLLGRKRQALRIAAAGTNATKTAETALPDKFAFGFDPYFAGQRPKPEHVEDLTRQLLVLERLFDVLFDANVRSILSVQRDAVETRMPPPKGEAAAPLYSRLHFAFRFTAGESDLLHVLDRLAAEKMFVVVTSLSVQKDGPDVAVVAEQEPARASAPADAATSISALFGGPAPAPKGDGETVKPRPRPEDLPRSERMVCGPRVAKPVTVGLEVDVYRFDGG